MDMVNWLQDDQPVVGMWMKQDLLYEVKRKGQVVRAYFSDWTPYTLQGQRWGLTHNGTYFENEEDATCKAATHLSCTAVARPPQGCGEERVSHSPWPNKKPQKQLLGELEKMLAQGHLRHHGSEAGRSQKKLKRAS